MAECYNLNILEFKFLLIIFSKFSSISYNLNILEFKYLIHYCKFYNVFSYNLNILEFKYDRLLYIEHCVDVII